MRSPGLQHRWARLWEIWRSAGARGILAAGQRYGAHLWLRFWMRQAGLSCWGRAATWLATWWAPPYKARSYLARLTPRGYIAPGATLYHRDLRLGRHVFIDDGTIIYQAHEEAGPVILGDRVHLHRGVIVEIGPGGSLDIGADTHVQPRCQFTAAMAPIRIGRDVQIAPYCAFYSYDHSFRPGQLIRHQPLQTKGGIVIEDDVWLGVGVIVLDGVQIGRGAVIGAGSVVTHSIPEEAIAVGTPARVISRRRELAPEPPSV
jgi:acetyltransferase-like isoleucine patch superfamily enzyme